MRALLVALVLSACGPRSGQYADTATYATASVTVTCSRDAGRTRCEVSTSAEVTRATP